MPGRDARLVASKVIVTEGVDDQRFFSAFVKFLGVEDIQVLPIGGKTRLPDELSNLISQSGFSRVAAMLIVRDADDDPRAAFDSVCGAIVANGLFKPSQPWEWQEGDNPKSDPDSPVKMRIMIMILPGADQIGALEEVVLRTVQDDPMLGPAQRLVSKAVSDLPPQNKEGTEKRAHMPSHRRGKATVHAFLATFEEPDKRLGEASDAGYWDFGHRELKPIADAIRAM